MSYPAGATARKRYERQGTLVEVEALERAEAESLSDADQREARRARDAERRDRLDAQYVRDFAHAIRVRYPAAPPALTPRSPSMRA